MFATIRQTQELISGLKMGVSDVASCPAKYKRTEGGVDMCADGNALDNWNTPPAGGWGFYENDFGKPVKCTPGAFCGRDGNF